MIKSFKLFLNCYINTTMCYSSDASKVSLTVNVITCFILYNYAKTDYSKIFALFFAFVGLMQLYDWIFWENLYPNNINYIFTKIAMISNHLQPIVLALLIYIISGKIGKFSQIIVLLYSSIALIYSINSYNNINYTLVSENSKPSLYWEWNDQPYSGITYLLFLLTFTVLCFENFNYPINIIFTLINLLSFFFTSYYYKGQNIGRFWCYISSYIPILVLFLQEINI
jgi:hypothetical protein